MKGEVKEVVSTDQLLLNWALAATVPQLEKAIETAQMILKLKRQGVKVTLDAGKKLPGRPKGSKNKLAVVAEGKSSVDTPPGYTA